LAIMREVSAWVDGMTGNKRVPGNLGEGDVKVLDTQLWARLLFARLGLAAKVIFHVREADWMKIAQRFSAG
jgi:hypothetical protein